MAVSTGTRTGSSSGGPGGGMMGGSGSGGSSRTAPSSSAGPKSSNSTSPKSSTSQAAKSPGAAPKASSPSAAKSSTGQAAKNPGAAPKASASPKPGGSGIIGSKGGGASVQKPGAGTGPAAAGKSSTLKAFTAGSNLAANRNQQMKTVGQGFIKSQTQNLKDQYSQYRSPPGVTAPKAPTAGGILRSPGQAAPPKNFASPQKPSGPTVNAGTSWTNPNGVPANVVKALADRGFAPDGTRLPTQAIAQDPALRGLNEKAKQNYKPAVGPGGMVGGMVYNRPDLGQVKPAAPAPKVMSPKQNASYFGDVKQPALAGWNSVLQREVTDPVKRGVNNLINAITGTPAPPQMKYAAPIGPQKPAATPGQLRAINTPDYGIDPSIPGRLQAMNAPSIPAPMPMRPGFQADNPILNPGPVPGMGYQAPVAPRAPKPVQDRVPSAMEVNASIMGMQPVNPNIGQVIGQDPITYGGPRIGTAPPGDFGVPRVGDNFSGVEAISERALTGNLLSGYRMPATTKPIQDRVGQVAPPAAGGMPAPTGQESIGPSVPTRAPGMPSLGYSLDPNSDAQIRGADRARIDAIVNALDPGQGATPVDTSPVTGNTYPGRGVGDAPTGADIAGVGNEVAAPAGAQNSYKVQRGDTLSKIAAKNGTTVKAIAEANGITNPNKIKPGQTLNIPTGASVQPMGNTLDGLDQVAAMMGEDYDYQAPPDPAFSGSFPFKGQTADEWMGTTYTEDGEVTSPESPSQEYDGPADENPSQDAGQADNVDQLVQRYNYEKQKAKDGIKQLPGRLLRAIVDGDFRGLPMSNDVGGTGRGPDGMSSGGGYYGGGGGGGSSDSDTDSLVRQLIEYLDKQQGGGILGGTPSQMDLVYNTFV